MRLAPRQIAVDAVGLAVARAGTTRRRPTPRRATRMNGAGADIIAEVERRATWHRTSARRPPPTSPREQAGDQAGQRRGDDHRGHEKDEGRALSEQRSNASRTATPAAIATSARAMRPRRARLGLGDGQREMKRPSLHRRGHSDRPGADATSGILRRGNIRICGAAGAAIRRHRIGIGRCARRHRSQAT